MESGGENGPAGRGLGGSRGQGLRWNDLSPVRGRPHREIGAGGELCHRKRGLYPRGPPEGFRHTGREGPWSGGSRGIEPRGSMGPNPGVGGERGHGEQS